MKPFPLVSSPPPRALSAQAASHAASLTSESLSGAYKPTSERPSSSRSTRHFLSKTMLPPQAFLGGSTGPRKLKFLVKIQVPGRLERAAGDLRTLWVHECLIANWLN